VNTWLESSGHRMFPALRVEVRGDADICARLATPKPRLLFGSS